MGNEMRRAMVASALLMMSTLFVDAGDASFRSGKLDHDVFFAEYRNMGPYDPGTWRLWFRNTSGKPQTVYRVTLNGMEVDFARKPEVKVDLAAMAPAAPADVDVLREDLLTPVLARHMLAWAVVTPNPVQPGQTAEIAIKPRKAPSSGVWITIRTDGGEEFERWISPTPPAMRIARIGFAEPGDRVWLYVRNDSAAESEITGLDVDGMPVAAEIWPPSGRVLPKDFAVIEWHPPAALIRGRALSFTVRSGSAAVACERTRVWNRFLLTAEKGNAPDGLLFPAESGVADYGGNNARSRGPAPAANRIMSCLSHEWGSDYLGATNEAFRRVDDSRRDRPEMLTFIQECRNNAPRGYLLFGEIADTVCVNPNLTQYLPGEEDAEHPVWEVSRLTRQARWASQPRACLVLGDCAPFGRQRGLARPDDLRRRLYIMVGEGVGGILFRNWSGWQRDGSADPNATVRAFNREMVYLSPHLAAAQPIRDFTGVGAPAGGKFSVLLAGRRHLVVVSVRVDAAHQAGQAEPRGVIDIPLAPWMRVASVSRVDPDGPGPIPWTVESDGGILRLDDADMPKTTAYIVDLAPVPGGSLGPVRHDRGGTVSASVEVDGWLDVADRFESLKRNQDTSPQDWRLFLADLEKRQSGLDGEEAQRQLLLRSDVARCAGFTREAVEYFYAHAEAVVALEGGDAAALAERVMQRARMAEQSGEWGEAAGLWLRLAGNGRIGEADRWQALLSVARLSGRLGLHGVQAEAYRRILAEWPPADIARQARRGLADMYRVMGAPKKAVGQYEALGRDYPDEMPFCLLQMGLLYQGQAGAKSAVQTSALYRRLVDEYPDSPYTEGAKHNLSALRKRFVVRAGESK